MPRLRGFVFLFLAVAFLCVSFTRVNYSATAVPHGSMVGESLDTGHTLRERITSALRGKKIFLLHAAKTGGCSSHTFVRQCAGHRFKNNHLNYRVDPVLLKDEHVLSSHIYTYEAWLRVLRELSDEAVVLVSVRPFDAWYPSAVMQVAGGHCVSRPRCRANGSACVITTETLRDITENRRIELHNHLGSFFTAIEELKTSRQLRATVFLVDMDRLDVVYEVISRMWCPSVIAKRVNDHVHKRRLYLDSGSINGTCGELSADVSRSQVDLLSLNDRPYPGWHADSIPAEVFERGFWEYALRPKHA